MGIERLRQDDSRLVAPTARSTYLNQIMTTWENSRNHDRRHDDADIEHARPDAGVAALSI